MIFIDANIPMYLVGQPHPNKERALLLLERVALDKVRMVTDAEVLQEILHRYRAIGRWEDGRRVYDLVRTLVPDIIELGVDTLDCARVLMDRYPKLVARDALHAAAVIGLGADAWVTWDTDFDPIKEINSLRPDQAYQ